MKKRGLPTENKKQKNEARIQNSSYYSERGKAGASGAYALILFLVLLEAVATLTSLGFSESVLFSNFVNAVFLA